MQFKNNIQKEFTLSGWYDGRDVLNKYTKIKYFNDFPPILKEFLKEYGDLKTKEANPAVKDNPYYFITSTDWAEYFEEEDYQDDIKTFGIRLFPFAYIETGDGFRVCCDENGQIYLLGGAILFLVANNFITGIEKIMESDASEALIFNFETKKWEPRRIK